MGKSLESIFRLNPGPNLHQEGSSSGYERSAERGAPCGGIVLPREGSDDPFAWCRHVRQRRTEAGKRTPHIQIVGGCHSHHAIDSLRTLGWSDAQIHDAVQVVALFNYYTRLADALGVEPEDFMLPH